MGEVSQVSCLRERSESEQMRKRLLVVATLVIIVAIGWFVWYRDGSSDSAAAASVGPQRIGVEAAYPSVATVSSRITALGTLVSNESVMIRPEIAGRVTEILFKEGQRVERKQPLIKLDDAIYVAQLEQAEANLALSALNDERAAKLFKQGAGTERSRDEAVSKHRVDKAAADLARATLEKMTLLAPFDGIIGLRSVSIGAYVVPGQDIANLEDIDSLKLDFRVPERYLTKVSTGMVISIVVDAYPERLFSGHIYAINPQVDESGRAIVIRARLGNQDGALRPGLFARLTLNADEVENAVMLPEEALVPRGEGVGVFRVVDDPEKGQSVEWAMVKTGHRQDGKVQITAGISKDDLVVTAGQLKIRNGSAVTVVPSDIGNAVLSKDKSS